MRNQNDQSFDDWSTVGTTVTSNTVDTEAFVKVEGLQTLTLSVTPSNDSIGFLSEQKTAKVCVHMKACDLPEDDGTKRPPVDIISTLDISGSMAGEKLANCKRTLLMMMRHLTSKDRFGLVTYGDAANVVIPACYMTEDNKERALQKIKAIRTVGCTNLSGGLFLSLQEMKLIEKPNPVRSIFLLTDGMANVGITDTSGLIGIVKSFNEIPAPTKEVHKMNIEEGTASMDTKPKTIAFTNESPISLFCFGYGANHNSDMLQKISDEAPGGAYYFVENDSDVTSAFGDAMGGILSVVAQSTVVTLSVPPQAAAKGVQILDVYHKEQIKRDNGSFTVNIGDFYAEETRDIVFEISLSNAPNDASVPHVHVSLSYMDTLNKRAASLGPLECLIKRPATAGISPTNADVEAQWLRVRVIQDIEAANREAQKNNFAGARSRMGGSLAACSVAFGHSPKIAMALQGDVEEVMRGFSSPSQYLSHGVHVVANKGKYLREQRSMESNASTTNIYRGKKKARLAKSFASNPK